MKYVQNLVEQRTRLARSIGTPTFRGAPDPGQKEEQLIERVEEADLKEETEVSVNAMQRDVHVFLRPC